MNNNPFYSLILPVYKVEKYLDRCINSIVKQEFKDFEIILVDDGSIDSCPQKCDEWSKIDSRIRVIHKKNEGLGYARNSGIVSARGKYIWFVDSDDSIEPGSLKTIHDSIVSNKMPSVIFFGYKRIDSNGNISFEEIQNPKKQKYHNKKEIITDLFPDFIFAHPNDNKIINICKSAWCCCINKKVFDEFDVRFVSEREYISEDYYFWIDNFDKFDDIVFIKQSFYRYYQNEDSLSLKYMSDRFERLKKFNIRLDELVKEHNYIPECYLRLRGLFISNLLGCLKSEIENKNNRSFFKKYNRFKSICKDKYVRESVDIYSCKNSSKGWRLFSFCIKHRLYYLLYISFIIRVNR